VSERIVYTAGHSTRTLDELVALLESAGVKALADIRRFPSSRRHPQHNLGELERGLTSRGIEYRWFGEELGGRRRQIVPPEESPNRAWQVAAFRNYADAMTSAPFLAAVARLEALALHVPTAFLCAEKLWWQCHRRLLADLLVARGWRVVHLLEPGRSQEHRLSEWARIADGAVHYPALV
jgi:uncharacterized protein (DUF488 family)